MESDEIKRLAMLIADDCIPGYDWQFIYKHAEYVLSRYFKGIKLHEAEAVTTPTKGE